MSKYLVLHKAHYGHTPAITIYYSTFLRFCQEASFSCVFFSLLHKFHSFKFDYLPYFSVLCVQKGKKRGKRCFLHLPPPLFLQLDMLLRYFFLFLFSSFVHSSASVKRLRKTPVSKRSRCFFCNSSVKSLWKLIPPRSPRPCERRHPCSNPYRFRQGSAYRW